MRALLLSALAATAAATVSGCGPAARSVNRGVESVNQPLVTRQDYAIDVRAADDGLAMGEERRLAGWFDALQIGYGDRVTIDDGARGGRPVHDAVARVAARYGLLLGTTPPVTEGAVPDDAVRIVVSRSAAFVPDCPNWTSASHPYVDGSTDRNYGCASNTNLALMVADPQDLIEGRKGPGSQSTRVATRALKTYNELVPTGTGGTVKAESAGTAR